MINNEQQLPAKNPPNPRKFPAYTGPRYDTILLDPPTDIYQSGRLGADQHYDLLSMDQLKQLPIGEIASDNAHLWLWSTNAALPYSLELLNAWGFCYRSLLTWGKPRFTLGQYLRNQTEQLILATRGRAPVQFRGQGTLLLAPLQDHSHKPEEQFAIIERASGPGPKLELFARRQPPECEGSPWSVWGNEIKSSITIPGFPVPSDFDQQEV